MYARLVCSCILIVICALPMSSFAENIALTSLEWPPYTGPNLVKNGASAEVVRQAFQAVGIGLEIHFFPWKRAINTALNDGNFVGYFPEYYDEHLSSCIFSESIGKSLLGFAQRVSHPVHWQSLDDLKHYSIGTVTGYINTTAFDDLVMQGVLHVDQAKNDETNLAKLALGRIDLAIIDRNVFNYLMATSPKLAEYRDLIQFNERVLENKNLYVCFRAGKNGKKMQEQFNAGLKSVHVNDDFNTYIKKALGEEQ